jgi:uncharacterized protein YbjT (DUF2867 family)
MILITGATGTIGSHVRKLLTSRGKQVRAMTRNPAGVPGGFHGDFDDPASLERAVAGVEAVFLVTAPAAPTADHDRNLLAAARKAGVRRIVKLSAIGTGETFGQETVGDWHVTTEQAVRDSGMAWTVLRPSSFASNMLRFADAIQTGLPIPNTTGEAAQGVIDPRDVAAVAAKALTTTVHTGQTLTLTGPELLSFPEQARILGRVLHRTVETVDVQPAAAREMMLTSGMHSTAVDTAMTGIQWARAGHNAILTDDVARVLDRAATSFETWALAHQDLFRLSDGQGV